MTVWGKPKVSFSSLPADELIAILESQIRDFELYRYIEDIETFRTVALDKVLEAFDDLEGRAAAMFSTSGRDDPEGDNFVATVNVRQGMLNLLAVFLWHLFEQQWKRIEAHSIERQFQTPSHPEDHSLKELRYAANAIKHGDGRSAQELADIRPDLFQTPHWESANGEPASPSAFGPPRPLMPLAGEGIYIGSKDLSNWLDSVVAYWRDFLDSEPAEPAAQETP